MFTQRSWVPSKSDHERGGKNIVQRWWPRRRSLNGVISAPLSGHFGTGGPAANCTLPQGEKNWQDTRGAWATFDSVTEMSQFNPKAKYLFYDVRSGQLLAASWSFPKQHSNASRFRCSVRNGNGSSRLHLDCICIGDGFALGTSPCKLFGFRATSFEHRHVLVGDDKIFRPAKTIYKYFKLSLNWRNGVTGKELCRR